MLPDPVGRLRVDHDPESPRGRRDRIVVGGRDPEPIAAALPAPRTHHLPSLPEPALSLSLSTAVPLHAWQTLPGSHFTRSGRRYRCGSPAGRVQPSLPNGPHSRARIESQAAYRSVRKPITPAAGPRQPDPLSPEPHRRRAATPPGAKGRSTARQEVASPRPRRGGRWPGSPAR